MSAILRRPADADGRPVPSCQGLEVGETLRGGGYVGEVRGEGEEFEGDADGWGGRVERGVGVRVAWGTDAGGDVEGHYCTGGGCF